MIPQQLETRSEINMAAKVLAVTFKVFHGLEPGYLRGQSSPSCLPVQFNQAGWTLVEGPISQEMATGGDQEEFLLLHSACPLEHSPSRD